jgi:hypothetical protein
MTKPTRFQLSRRKGWRMPGNTVKVDRTTPWGNPFIVGIEGSRADCVGYYQRLIAGYLLVSGKTDIAAQKAARAHALDHLAELRGKNLACWCPLPAPGEPDCCHAAVLLEIANAPEAA